MKNRFEFWRHSLTKALRVNHRIVVDLFLVSIVGITTQTLAQVSTQTFTLQPGWNSIYLEVQPSDNSTTSVFSNLPVASVWTRAERLSSADFIQDPSEAAFNNPAWLRWFPPLRAEAFLGNLFAVFANRAYLIRVTNGAPLIWSVTGRPSLRQLDWVPDSYNLRGAPVDPISPPTFLNFFRSSKAHFNSMSNQLEKIYRLNSATGQWQLVAPADLVQSGAAYWIYTRGASDYLAPLTAKVELGDGLDFGLAVTELDIRIANLTAGPMSATVREVNSGGNGHLACYQFSPTLGGQWPGLPSPFVVSPAAGSETRLRLAVKRQDFTSTNYASILEVRDGVGTRVLVPVSAQAPGSTVAAAFAAIGKAGKSFASPAEESRSRAGLWVGSATLNAVSEPRSANPTNATPTKSQLNLTLIIHVDTNGQARLLKEVTQMWRDGTYTNDGSGNKVVEKPGQYVLLTDDTLIPFFAGAAIRDGESVGRRISTVGYDFPSSSSNNFLNLTGPFAIGQKLTATLNIPFDHPTNPFKHKYHPDHDNLNARFDGPAVESYTTVRQIELVPSATPPDGPAAPDYGYNLIGGAYRETITGIHKSAIRISGTFRLSRVSLTAQLNPSPTP
jgi:hypothetical protein